MRTAEALADWLMELESRATPGPWSITCEGFDMDVNGYPQVFEPSTIPEILTIQIDDAFYPSQNDNVLIAHMRNNLPFIIEALRVAGNYRAAKSAEAK